MPTPIEFVFTEDERQQAVKEGLRRQGFNESKGLRGRNGGAWKGSKALDIHLLGAAGEMAVASHLGMKHLLYKETQAKRGSDDLPGMDIKTRSKHSYDLIVQKNEDPRKKFVLVTIQDKTTLIHGWCYGRDAMKEEFWADPARGRPAYFVPKEALAPIDSLNDQTFVQ
jgi:hypothetical protein